MSSVLFDIIIKDFGSNTLAKLQKNSLKTEGAVRKMRSIKNVFKRGCRFFIKLVNNTSGNYEVCPISYYDTMLMYYLGVDTSKMKDLEWARAIKVVLNIRKKENKGL